MPLIKRYSNRKLYNTETRQYVTLDEIAALIRQGQQVQVVDHTSGEDLTALTLSQIILEQEKRTGGFLPKTVLAGLVQAGGNTLAAVQRALTFSFDLMRHVDAEIERRVRVLVRRGELTEKEGARWLDKLIRADGWTTDVELTEQALRRALERRKLASRTEVEQLAQKIDALSVSLDHLGSSRSSRTR